MNAQTTKDIRIKVLASTEPHLVKNQAERYLFAYRIHIENLGDQPVQLLRRHWYIYDSNGSKREVEGEGVIGKQPTLLPGDSYSYESWCPLYTEVGKMNGSYQMVNKNTEEHFDVVIPEFLLIASSKLN